MTQEMIVDAILLGPVGVMIVFGALKLFFKNSILFKIGFVMGLFGLIMANIVMWSNGIGHNSYIWTIPSAFLALYFSFRYLNKQVKHPLSEITDVFDKLKNGDVTAAKKLSFQKKDEFGAIADSANQLINGFTNLTHFAQEIGKGNLDVEYEVLGDRDLLGHSVLEMKTSLQHAQEEDRKRKLEDQKVQWTNEGFARFGDILRNNTEDNKEFYYSIISHLVKYVGANQGGLFLINDDDENDTFIELAAMYAYERRKYAEKRLEMGESLIGQCVLEGESIYMTDIPQNYIRITSGLGEANPSSILIVPLIFNEKVYGVIELASFHAFEPYKRSFIEKLGESIASTLSTYKINLRTVKLLEDSKMQSEELAAQEEEIRQNMEELQTTQEESSRREAEMTNILEAIQTSVMMVELDLKGRVLAVNDAYAAVLESNPASMKGNHWVDYLNEREEDNFADVLEHIKQEEHYQREVTLKSGRNVTESYHLISDADHIPTKILSIGGLKA